jgi:oligosaccharide repeat unit polymerase
LFSLFTGKVIDKNVGSANTISDILSFGTSALLYPYEYMIGSLAAFNEVALHPQEGGFPPGAYSISFVYNALAKLGFTSSSLQLPDHLREFVHVGGIDTNVYTFLYDFVLDFGLVGSLLAAPLLATLHTYLDNRSSTTKSIPEFLLIYISILAGFLSFVSFRYGDTLFMATAVLALLHNMYSVVNSWPQQARNA